MPRLHERDALGRFGICRSFVRGEQTAERHAALLVTCSGTPDLLECVNLKRALEALR